VYEALKEKPNVGLLISEGADKRASRSEELEWSQLRIVVIVASKPEITISGKKHNRFIASTTNMHHVTMSTGKHLTCLPIE